jgi:hypothetical protein
MGRVAHIIFHDKCSIPPYLLTYKDRSRETDESQGGSILCIPSLMQASHSWLIPTNHRRSDDPKHWHNSSAPQLLGAELSLVGWAGVFKQTGFLADLFLELEIEPCISFFLWGSRSPRYNKLGLRILPVNQCAQYLPPLSIISTFPGTSRDSPQ